jgi:hypothetical protein
VAYWHLISDPLHRPEEITKKKVKDLAIRFWAFKNLVDLKKMSGLYSDELELTPNQKILLQREIERLEPTQRWQKLWPIAALENLPGSKRGPNRIP